MTAAVPPRIWGCPRLVHRAGSRYAREICNHLPVGKDGLCKHHRYLEKKAKERKR